MTRWLSLWFGFDAPVRPRQYLLTGVALMLVKFAGDAALFAIFGRVTLTPLDYLSPLAGDLAGKWAVLPDAGRWPVVFWLLPFVWIGASMTFRRAQDAGLWPGLGILFFAPLLNYVVMVGLALAPTRARAPARLRADAGRLPSLVGLLLAISFPLAMIVMSVHGFERYGFGIFVGTPFAMGVFVGYALNVTRERTVGQTTVGCGVVLLVVALSLLVLSMEGMACIVMATPIILPLSWLGAMLGRGLARMGTGAGTASTFVLLPLGLLALDERPAASPERAIVTSVEIDAPPEAVWPHVVAFSDLPPPRHWLFGFGIAYPVRARIDGRGAGAVRRCEFSTGPFVEPITHWQEPVRLAFDVIAQPPPMREMSPFGEIHPPHLDGWFRALRGEFRLVALAGGRTRLEGTTWYSLDLAPEFYWRPWAEALVHAIHGEVLVHIDSLAR